MKILIVNTYDLQGGAARAASRLHNALLASGVDSQMLVQSKISDDDRVIGPSNRLQKVMAKIRPKLDGLSAKLYQNKTKTLFSPSQLPYGNIIEKINIINPDIVHLHWICDGMITIEELAHIKAPLVWSLHDMWAFTGGCHYNEDCAGYKMSCGNCKVLCSNKKNDLSTKTFQRKQKIYASKKNMTIVGLSKWLTECSKTSTLLKYKDHINLPNPIDTKTFKPTEKNSARELYGFPKGKKLVLFVAAPGTIIDPRKGFKKLIKAIEALSSQNIEFVSVGNTQKQYNFDFSFKIHYLANLSDDISLATIYNAVDVLVIPSIQENLSNVVMESLACGTPVVGFDIGGNSDMINHKENGYLATPFESDDLARGIEWVLDKSNYDKLCDNAREKIIRDFDSSVVVKKYINLYNHILK